MDTDKPLEVSYDLLPLDAPLTPESVTATIDIPVSIPEVVIDPRPDLHKGRGPSVLAARHVVAQTDWYTYDGLSMRDPVVPRLTLGRLERVAVAVVAVIGATVVTVTAWNWEVIF